MVRKTLKKIFQIREGELAISLLMQCYIFLVIMVLLIVKPTVNALFLSGLGAENLPMAYMLTALVAITGFYFYNKAIKRFSLKSIIYVTLIFFGLCFLLLSLLLHFSWLNVFSLYAYYIGVSLFAVLVASQFWILANMVFNSREAKRLFGFIGAGAISGGILGGYFTSVIASSYGNKITIAFAALLLFFCIPILNAVWSRRIKALSVYTIKQRMFSEKETSVPAFKLIIKSKHLGNLAGIVAVGVVMAKLVDFQFSDFAHNVFSDSDELASFFGFWFSTFNVIALSIQLLLTNKIMNRLGVATTLLLMPLAIALGCLLFLTFPELWVLILLKGIDGTFKQSVYKAALELSIMPIPFQIKNQAKSYIDVVVDSIASGIAGLLLFFVIKKWEVSTIYVTVIILFFLFVWIFLIYRLREAYFESFRKNLKTSLVQSGKYYARRNMAATLRNTKNILNNGTAEEIVLLLKKLDEFKLKAIKSDILALLNHPSDEVKTHAIRQLYVYDKGTAFENVQNLIYSKKPSLAAAAMEYLLENTHIEDKAPFESYLNNENKQIANAALICLAKEVRNNNKLRKKYDFDNRLRSIVESNAFNDINFDEHQLITALLAIGYGNNKEFYSFINNHLKNDKRPVKKNAIRAAGLTADFQFVHPLLKLLEDKTYRKQAIKALKRYGDEISRTLYSMEKQEILADTIKPYIPKVIGSFKNQNSVRTLIQLLKNKDIRTRLEASRRLRKMRQADENLSFPQGIVAQHILKESKSYSNTLKAIDSISHVHYNWKMHPNLHESYEDLLLLLQEQLNLSLQCIFEMLSLRYHFADMEVAYYGITSNQEQTANNAMEFLDNLLHSRLKDTILPLLEHRLLETTDTDSSKKITMSEYACVKMLIKNRGKRIKLACLQIIYHSKDKRYFALLKRLQRHKNPEIQQKAIKTLSQLEINMQEIISA
ncbi:hypothetical protein HME9304_01755 [Flagellimonas maritima]|uniref:ADP,ATP carrier protein n=1 Tax=Flagellimonas maritima TaxID=1383885 RepID=A0A2Z4LSQ0_9FLAO|nr:Npt1/Npt2 family nucleotide transporter [Allomuricauda aurantiaca]AWX44752.1 hypothetical protein HME9304_01755 [Allomuricauda aurantiaca]